MAKEPIRVKLTPTSPIAAAEMSEVSSVRVGNEGRPAGFPVQVLETRGALEYLLDIRPKLEGERMVAVRADDQHAHGMAVVASYKERKGDEIVIDPAGVVEDLKTYERDHKLLAQFGAGEASHTIMFDIVEGMTINLPGSYAECIVVDMTQTRELDMVALGYLVVETQASASLQSHPRTSQYTTKVYTAYQVDLDLLDPPTFEDFKKSLVDALCNRTILAVA